VDFNVPYKHSPSYSIGDYVIEFLLKTFDIIKSSPNIKNEVIVHFFKAETKDHRLPFKKDYLFKNLRCSDTFSDNFLLAQSSFFAVSFEPLEYKNLGPLDFIPFAVDAHTNLRAGGYGMVEKVFEDDKPLARKTISDNYDLAKDNDGNQNLGPGH
jgi:hypothetical protein